MGLPSSLVGIAIALTSATGLSKGATVTLTLQFRGAKLETKQLSAALMSNGALATSDITKLVDGGGFTKSWVYSNRGRCLREVMHERKKKGQMVNMTFDSSQLGETVTFSNGPNSRSLFTKYPAGTNLDNESEFWFIRDHPKPGTVLSYILFDPLSRCFRRTTNTYVGDVKINYHGHKVTAHKVVDDGVTKLVDGNGLPYVYIDGPSQGVRE